MLTRKQYMRNECTHHEYYSQFGKYLVSLVASRIGKQRILDSQDPNLNDIPLEEWSDLHTLVRQGIGQMIREANGGGGISLSDTVCAAKAAAVLLQHRSKAGGAVCITWK